MAAPIDKTLLLRLVVVIICFAVIGYILFMFATQWDLLLADPCSLCEDKTGRDCTYPGELKPFMSIPDELKLYNFTKDYIP